MTKTFTDAQIVGSVSFINGDVQQFTSRFPLTLHHGAPERSARPCRDWFSAVCSTASGWMLWWTATMCIAS